MLGWGYEAKFSVHITGAWCFNHLEFYCYFFYRRRCYNDNPNLPIYQHTACRYNAQKIVEVLLNPKLPLSRISTTRPVSVQDNVVFIVDLSKLDKPEDIRADDLGSWQCNGKRFIKCTVDKGRVTELVAQRKGQPGKTYTLVRRYYEHTTSRDFKRTIAEIYGEYIHPGAMW